MERYLKSVSVKAFDGSAIKIPFCCINCKKDQCGLPCQEYADEMKEQKCSRFEMEFGVHEGFSDYLKRHGVQLVLAIGLMIVGCKLADSMKATSLLQLKENAEEVRVIFERSKNDVNSLDEKLKGYAQTINGLTSPMDELSKFQTNLLLKVNALEDEVKKLRQLKDNAQAENLQ